MRGRKAVGRVIPYFANLLPEGDLRGFIARRAQIHAGDDLALLRVVGIDLVGATLVRDPRGRPVPPAALGGPGITPPREDLLRFSVPGVQLKFSAVRNAAGGLTISGSMLGDRYLAKLPSMVHPLVPQNEYRMMDFARTAGLEVPPP